MSIQTNNLNRATEHRYILVGNFGNPSIALLQWVIERNLSNVCFVSIDTHWAGKNWNNRVEKAQDYAYAHRIKPIRLKSPICFASLVRQRKEFPSQEFKWCASLLKGSVLNAWLDEIDPHYQAIILLAKQRTISRAYNNLPEIIKESEYYGGRKVWHPLVEYTLAQRNSLIERTPFELLTTRSLECDPCILSTAQELNDMHPNDVNKLRVLEQQVGRSMHTYNHSAGADKSKTVNNKMTLPQSKEIGFLKVVSMGCGSPWGCGE